MARVTGLEPATSGVTGRRVVSAFIATAFAEETPETASLQWRAVADQIRPKVPKLATIMDDAEPDVLAYMTFLKEHCVKLHSINPIERLSGEIKRRTGIVGTFVSFDSASGLIGAFDNILLAEKDPLFAKWPLLPAHLARREDILAMRGTLFLVVASGVAVKIPVHGRIPLAEAAEAHCRLEARQTTGAAVLLP